MSDSTLTDKVKAFFANAQVQLLLKAALGTSGFAFDFLNKHYSITLEQAGTLFTLIIQFGPAIVVLAIELAQRTHAAIINKAAQILADRNAGTIVINSNASDSVKALADSPASPVQKE
jgi:hypothetical protein